MTEILEKYLHLVKLQEEVELYKKELENDNSNLDVIFSNLDFNKLEKLLMELGWQKSSENEYYILWQNNATEDIIPFITNKQVSNWSQNIESNLRDISKINDISYDNLVRKLFEYN